jgi:uncharacterized protein (TIGR00106 family)
MKVLVDICVIPMTGRVSVRKEVARAHAILAEAPGVTTRLHGYGTNVEGEWDVVFGAIKRVHEELHGSGIVRISSTLRVGTRTDKDPEIARKIQAVEDELA